MRHLFALLTLPLFIALPAHSKDNSSLSAERGFYIYKDVCSACHSMKEVHYGDFIQLGVSKKIIENWAATKSVPDGVNDNGSLHLRPAELTDPVSSPYPTENAARKDNGGDLPPDLSSKVLLIKGGSDYIKQMLLGYQPTPSGITLKPKDYYNPIALTHHHHFHMPNPWKLPVAHNITYPDSTHPSEQQMAEDVTNFLKWTATPYQNTRALWGYIAIVYSVCMSAILFILRRQIWSSLL